MNNKVLGGLVAVLGVAMAIVGYVVFYTTKYGFHSKRLDGTLGLGVILAIVGIVMLVMPASRKA